MDQTNYYARLFDCVNDEEIHKLVCAVTDIEYVEWINPARFNRQGQRKQKPTR